MFLFYLFLIMIGLTIAADILGTIVLLLSEQLGLLAVAFLYAVPIALSMQLGLIYQLLLYKSLVDLKPELSNTPPVGKRWVYVIFAAIGLFIVVVIGFVFSIPQPHYGGRDTARVANLESVRTYLEAYNVKCGHYPGIIDIKPECSSPDVNNNWTELTKTMSAAGITSKLPNDPTPEKNYFYGVEKPNGLRFVVGAAFERNNNKLRNDVDGIIYGVDCNDPVYCVSSD